MGNNNDNRENEESYKVSDIILFYFHVTRCIVYCNIFSFLTFHKKKYCG